MSENTLKYSFIPELGTPKSGKVREIYDLGDKLLLITSDRLSAFNRQFDVGIADKGRILNGISKFWFDQTEDIIPNHIISYLDPNVFLVKKCRPILVEVVVRGYIVGSLWRDYAKGKRVKCGVCLPEGLKENDRLPQPIITPTLKNKEDTETTKKALIDDAVVTKKQWDQIEEVSLKLFKRGTDLAKDRGIVLVDTKYEFGLDENDNLVLIDEIHTPDSSRFWYSESLGIFQDKEFIRKWLLENGCDQSLPEELIVKARQNYLRLYEAITGNQLEPCSGVKRRILLNLVKARLIQGFFVAIVGDDICNLEGVPCGFIENSTEEIKRYNDSLEPVIFVSLEPIETKWPVLPPDKKKIKEIVL